MNNTIPIIIYTIGYFIMLYFVKKKNSWFHEPESKTWYIACLCWPILIPLFPLTWIADIIQRLKRKKILDCEHKITRYEDWPDGSAIEICTYCGKSRNISEWDESPWVMVDIEECRKILEAYF